MNLLLFVVKDLQFIRGEVLFMTPFWGELVGTMILIVFGAGIGAGSSLKGSYAKDAGWIVITIAWGLAVTMGIFAVGSISGAHLNPAVTIGFAIIGKFPWSDVPVYIAAQLIGAILGQPSYSFIICHTGRLLRIQVRSLVCSPRLLPSRIHFPIY